MGRVKKITSSALMLSFLLGGTLLVNAQTLASRYVTLVPNYDGYAATYDSYVTAAQNGTVEEDHSLRQGACTGSFKASLELRKPWYQPNEIRDTSTSVNGWNATSATNGQQFRTLFEGYTYNSFEENSSYYNY